MAYPTSIDNFAGQVGAVGNPQNAPSMITLFQNLVAAMVATQTELGTNPSLANATVRELLEQATFRPGDVKISAVDTPPTGWLQCDGQAVSRVTFAALFAAIGTTYGAGDGSTTFNVPTVAGRAIMGSGQGAGLTQRNIGAIPGTEAHTLSAGEVPLRSHSHSAPVRFGLGSSHNHSSNPGTVAEGNQGAGIAPDLDVSSTSIIGVTAHNNMQPSIALKVLIKT